MARAESCWTIDSSVASDLRTQSPGSILAHQLHRWPQVTSGIRPTIATVQPTATAGRPARCSASPARTGDNLTRDVNYTKDATFAVDLANGDYDVIVTLGDTGQPHDLMGVFLEGAQVDTVTTTARPDRSSHLSRQHWRRPAQPPAVRSGRQRSLGHDQRPRYRLRRCRSGRSARDIRRSPRHRHRASGSNPTWLQRSDRFEQFYSRGRCAVGRSYGHDCAVGRQLRWELPNSRWSLHHRTRRASIAWL